MPFVDVRDYILRGYRYEDEYIRKILQENSYTVGKPMRGSYPKMIDYNDDQNGTSRKIHLVKFETARCYEFKRADFTATEISSLQGELPLIMPQVQNEVVSSTEQITIDEF